MIDILVQYKAKTTSPERTHEIRIAAECRGSLDMAIRIREGRSFIKHIFLFYTL
jgi:hypothetical protein